VNQRSETVAKLKGVARFSELSDRELKKVAEAGTYLKLPAQRTLMSETTPADKAYVILAGEVAIRHKGETIATVGAGNIVGEVGILQKRLRTAGVVALTDLEVVHFTNDDLSRLVAEIPALDDALTATAEAHAAQD